MTPHFVQEALATTPRIGQEHFTFLLCQHGVEPTLKARWLGGNSPWRLAFSRPGLLTFKNTEGDQAAAPIGDDWMVRLAGLVLGQVKGELAESMVDEALERMKKMLESNKAMQTLVSGEAGETVEKDM